MSKDEVSQVVDKNQKRDVERDKIREALRKLQVPLPKDRPVCKQCGKPLRPYTHAEDAETIEDVEHMAERGDVVTRQHLQSYCGSFVNVWRGEWGSYGDNLFCGLRCGYRYGKASAEKKGRQ